MNKQITDLIMHANFDLLETGHFSGKLWHDDAKIKDIRLVHGNAVAVQEGEFYLDLAKILDINLDDQTCVFAIGLKKKQ